MIYFDNAATSFPKPNSVLNASADTARRRGGNPGRGGHALARAADAEVHRCRKAIKEFFNAPSAESVAFAPNATAALNTCIFGLVKPGDRVITTDFEHNSVRRPLYRLKDVTVRKATVTFDDDDATVAEFRRMLSEGADWLVVSHASNVWGKTIPLREICKAAHAAGARVIVDAAQTAGHKAIDVSADGIDYLCAPGHKGLYGPQGTGFMIINGEPPSPLLAGGTGSNSLSPEQPDYLPDALESGTLNVPAISGLREGISYLNFVGAKRIHMREIALLQRAYHGLKGIKGAVLYTSAPTPDDSPALSFNLEGKSSFEAAELYDRYGLCLRAGYHCAPDAHEKLGTSERGTVRMSVGAFNTASEIDYFLLITQKILKYL